MCLSPNPLPNGSLVGCRKCWQCRENRIKDWAGRCIAESRTAKHTVAVTLTYGRDRYGASDHMNAMVLTYSDVQGYFKLLRKAGHPLRYLVVGEYGTLKGRAHWHAILFFSGTMPDDVKIGTMFTQKHWSHGHSLWDKADYKAVRYVCKYLNKDAKDETKNIMLRMSKKPPLGDQWFRDYARQYVEHGLAPQNLTYKFPEIRQRNRHLVEFIMMRHTAENFLGEYVRQWEQKHPGRHIPSSELVEEYLDSLEPEDLRLQRKQYARKRDVKEAKQAWDELKAFTEDAKQAREAIAPRKRAADRRRRHLAQAS